MTDPHEEIRRLRDRLAELEAIAGNPASAGAVDFNDTLRGGRRRIVDAPDDAPGQAPVRTDMNALLRGRSADTPTEPEGDDPDVA